MTDSETTVSELRKLVSDFVQERDWEKFHAPKNVSMALAIEAAELMEHFQWISIEESRTLNDPRKREQIGEELADIICYALALANSMGLDVSETLKAKMRKNKAKYPVERYRGTFE